jgi:hypothetical protein
MNSLSRVVYRSRAVQPMTPPDLHALATSAQARNREEQLTGLVVYDRDTFFQWLEGPSDSLNRVLDSIMHDPRHTDIEILDSHPLAARRFGNWYLKVAARLDRGTSFPTDVINAPRQMVDELHRHPDDAAMLLPSLAMDASAANDRLAPRSSKGQRRPGRAQRFGTTPSHSTAILETLIQSRVIPELAGTLGRAAAAPPGRPTDHHAPELARLLIAPDPKEAADLIAQLRAREPSLLPLYASLFEPTARSLGDLWNDDLCSEGDVTLGLCRLQTSVRLLGADDLPPIPAALPGYSVLVAPEPGELHLLNAALDSEVLWHAGWAAHCEYPDTDSALQDLVSTTWFDALDLSLSSAFRREHWLPKVTDTITRARRASCNPALVVVVGGRVFTEQQDAGARVGADASGTTALEIADVILQGMGNTRAERRG